MIEIKEAIELLSIYIPRPQQEQEALNLLIDLAYKYLEAKHDYTRSCDVALLRIIIDCQSLEIKQIREYVERWKNNNTKEPLTIKELRERAKE